jgi:hypothetical protein
MPTLKNNKIKRGKSMRPLIIPTLSISVYLATILAANAFNAAEAVSVNPTVVSLATSVTDISGVMAYTEVLEIADDLPIGHKGIMVIPSRHDRDGLLCISKFPAALEAGESNAENQYKVVEAGDILIDHVLLRYAILAPLNSSFSAVKLEESSNCIHVVKELV